MHRTLAIAAALVLGPGVGELIIGLPTSEHRHVTADARWAIVSGLVLVAIAAALLIAAVALGEKEDHA